MQQKRHTRMSQHSTTSHSSLSYQKIILHIHSILANLRDPLYYIREVAIHTMDYIDAATTSTLSHHLLPVEDLRKMLLHIEETLPSTMPLPISSEDALHFCRYLHMHILIADEQFLLLTDVPTQDCTQQLKIYEVFNLAIPHRTFSAHYNIKTDIWELHMTKPRQWKSQKIASKHDNRLTDNFAVCTHHFYHPQTQQHVYQLYMPRTRLASRK